jgi:hypothetical protein
MFNNDFQMFGSLTWIFRMDRIRLGSAGEVEQVMVVDSGTDLWTPRVIDARLP